MAKKSKWCIAVSAVMAAVVISGCQGTQNETESEIREEQGYQRITQEEAASIIDSASDYIILDVRTQAEYDEGHIPGAICIPNEEITDVPPGELPQMDQQILVYCRSGRRSKEAAEKLAHMGYTNVLEFGGIQTWDGDIER